MTVSAKPSKINGRRKEAPPVETVEQEVERVLRSSSHSGLRNVRCTFRDGCATLRGEVSSFYLKQIAQTLVGRLSQVHQVKNELCVVRPDELRRDA